MTRPRGGAKAKVTVQNSWLNKSLEERIAILRHISPQLVDAIGMMVDFALRQESDLMDPRKEFRKGGA